MPLSSRLLTGLLAALLATPMAPAGLVGYWNFNEGSGTTANDSSGNANTGTLGGAVVPLWVAGHTGNASDKALNFPAFPGTTWAKVNPSASLATMGSQFTLALWVREAGTDYYGNIFTTKDAAGGSRKWYWQNGSGGDQQNYVGSDTTTGWTSYLALGAGSNLPAGTWKHIALTYDAAGGNTRLKYYLDGALVGTGYNFGGTTFPAFAYALFFGGPDTNGGNFIGDMDDIVLLNHTATAAEMLQIKDGTYAPMVPPPVWTGTGTPNGSGQLLWTSAANWGGITMAAGKTLAFATTAGLITNNNDFANNTQFLGITFNSGSGAFILAGNTINLTGDVVNSSSSTQTISNILVLDGGDRAINTALGNVVVNSSISQAQIGRGLDKTGSNTLTLLGTNTYTGATNVNSGTLRINGRMDGTVIVQTNSHLAAGPDATTLGVATLGNGLTLNAAYLDIKAAAPGTSDAVNVTGNLALSGNTTLVLSEQAGFANGDYVILTYTGTLTGDPATQIIPPTQNASHSYSIQTTTVADMKQIKLHVAAPSAAKTYFVSQSGNDSNSGLDGSSAAWKTLAKASSVSLNPGDSILLKCGDTWNEELHPIGNGSAAAPIVIGAYGTGNKPLIDRLDYTQDRIGIHLVDQEGFKIVGIEFSHCQTGIFGEYADASPTKRFIWIENCYFHDSLLYGGSYANYPSPKNISLGISFFSYERDNNIVLQDITIKNCVFRRLASAIWTNNPDNFTMAADYIYNFGNFVIRDCLFEEGYQWQLGMRGVAGGVVRDCVTHDIGRGFTAFNGVAGAMFFRCKYWLFENSEWGFISRGGGSGDGEAFDFEGNCDHMVMRNCLFHDTDGPGFLICMYASNWNPHTDLRMENCVLNGKALNSAMTRSEIYNTTDFNQATWKNTRFYLSSGEKLMHIADPETTNNSAFINCQIKDLAYATSSPKLIATPSASSGTAANANDGNDATAWTPTSSTNQWIQLDFATPTTVNEFRIKETAGSVVTRYAIECWDDRQALWVSCFNGRTIGSNYVAPIVSRTTQKARLWITSTGSGNPVIAEFQAYNDMAGQTFSTLRDPVTINVDPPTGVTQSATTTTLRSSPNPAGVGQSVTLAASVSSAAGTPTGTVNFNEGAALLGTGTLNGNGVATFSTSALAAGTHTITATYVGSHYCLTSTSTSISQGVNP